MTDRKTIEAVITRCYAARQKGDIETLMAAFDPDAVFELAGSKELVPAAEAARGHQAIRATMTGLIAVFDFIDRNIICMAIDGERAAVHSRVTICSKRQDFYHRSARLISFQGRKDRRTAGVCRYRADQGFDVPGMN